ncbi:hypothetical protein Q5752_002091 [Cryptotrichosporon argae]
MGDLAPASPFQPLFTSLPLYHAPPPRAAATRARASLPNGGRGRRGGGGEGEGGRAAGARRRSTGTASTASSPRTPGPRAESDRQRAKREADVRVAAAKDAESAPRKKKRRGWKGWAMEYVDAYGNVFVKTPTPSPEPEDGARAPSEPENGAGGTRALYVGAAEEMTEVEGTPAPLATEHQASSSRGVRETSVQIKAESLARPDDATGPSSAQSLLSRDSPAASDATADTGRESARQPQSAAGPDAPDRSAQDRDAAFTRRIGIGLTIRLPPTNGRAHEAPRARSREPLPGSSNEAGPNQSRPGPAPDRARSPASAPNDNAQATTSASVAATAAPRPPKRRRASHSPVPAAAQTLPPSRTARPSPAPDAAPATLDTSRLAPDAPSRSARAQTTSSHMSRSASAPDRSVLKQGNAGRRADLTPGPSIAKRTARMTPGHKPARPVKAGAPASSAASSRASSPKTGPSLQTGPSLRPTGAPDPLRPPPPPPSAAPSAVYALALRGGETVPRTRAEAAYVAGFDGLDDTLRVNARNFVENVRRNLRAVVAASLPDPTASRNAFLDSVGRGLVDLGWALTDTGDGAFERREE